MSLEKWPDQEKSGLIPTDSEVYLHSSLALAVLLMTQVKSLLTVLIIECEDFQDLRFLASLQPQDRLIAQAIIILGSREYQ